MKIYKDDLPSNHDAWSGAVSTLETIREHNKEKDFDYLIEELYPDGIDETTLNDILWFESEWLFENLGINEEEEEDEEDEDEDEEDEDEEEEEDEEEDIY